MKLFIILISILFVSFKIEANEFIITDSTTLPPPIIIAKDAGKKLNALAGELKGYLDKITGKKFVITTTRQTGRAIILGTVKQFSNDINQNLLLKKKLITGDISDREAFAITQDGDKLFLIGNTNLGVSHAVFRLLEELGCRWFFPTKTWEVIPRKQKLAIFADIVDRPKILSRSIWYQWGFIHDEKDGYKRSSNDYKNWQTHNCMAKSFQTSVGHIWQQIYAVYKKEFDANPDYFLWDIANKRYRTREHSNNKHDIKIDTYHPEVESIFKKYVLDYFKKHPKADMIGTGPSDGYIRGLMSKSNPKASTSDICFHGTKVAALAIKEAAKTDPLYKNKYVGQYAYADYSDPPSYKLPDNVYIELTGGFISGKHSYTELLDIWPKHIKQMGFYRYYSVFQWNHDTLPGNAGANVVQIRKNIPQLYHKQHAIAISAESGNNWGLNGRGYYLANKLMWNPDADSDAILADFYKNAFGPAADVMKHYYEIFDPGNEPFMSRYLLGVGAGLISEASELTKNNPECAARINDLKIFWGYVMLRWRYDKAVSAKDEKLQMEYAKKICELAYRSRFRYMNHWEAIRQQWLGGGGLKLPIWKNTATAPWKGMPDYTVAEIDKIFKIVEECFPPQILKFKTFSNNLVPIAWPNKKDRIVKAEGGIWQGGHLMWIYSFGEPIKLTIYPNLTGLKKSTVCTLKNSSGKTLAVQKKGLNEKLCEFSFNVPKPGLYQVWVDNVFWRLKNYNNSTPMVIPTKIKYIHSGWQTPTSFYVPKGTKNLMLIGVFSGDCDIFADGSVKNVVGKIKKSKNDEVQSIPVPEGEDGKVWTFKNVLVNKLWFLNAPNFLGYSPYGIMVPKELAEKDGLTIMSEKLDKL